MTRLAPSYRVSLRLYVVLSLLMAVSAAASGLLLLYLARPFISELGSEHAVQATALLFAGAGLAGAAAAVGGLIVGFRLAGRIRVIVRKAEAAVFLPAGAERTQSVTDELGALDAAVGRLTMSVDQFVRDSDILSRLPEGMLLVLPTEELLSFNTTAEILLGLPLERFKGVPILSPPGVFPLWRGNEALARLLGAAAARQHSVHMSEVAATTAPGQELRLEVTVQHREWGADSTAIVLLFRDASEKQRIRDEIRRADQLALLGGMAARVAHEIRTPLSTIRGLLELLQADLPEARSGQEYMKRIIQAVDRQDRLVENLLTLSNPEPEVCQAVSVPALIEDVVDMLPHDPRIRVSTDTALPPVWGDAFRLSEVFTNLIQNALEAAPSDGVVDVRMVPGVAGQVRVSVRNTGAGIPPELKERIFQPFFTTKPRGTGLGLAIARQIVDAHHGSLSMTSDGVAEVTFMVELPTTAAPGAAQPSREETVRGERG
jgi:two-component system, NtrC family, sensor histidine kinase AtoS